MQLTYIPSIRSTMVFCSRALWTPKEVNSCVVSSRRCRPSMPLSTKLSAYVSRKSRCCESQERQVWEPTVEATVQTTVERYTELQEHNIHLDWVIIIGVNETKTIQNNWTPFGSASNYRLRWCPTDWGQVVGPLSAYPAPCLLSYGHIHWRRVGAVAY